MSSLYSRSRSRGESVDAENQGNNLYVTGLSARVTKKDLQKHFANEGDVVDVHLVVDPWTRESRGFGFVTMGSIKDANRCLKYLDRSVLEGRVITVEKARRGRGRTPTPGRYLGRSTYECRRSPSYSPYHCNARYDSPGYSSSDSGYRRHRSYSRSKSPYADRRSPVWRSSRSHSPVDSYSSRAHSPVDSYSSRAHSVSPYYRRRYYHSPSLSPTPWVGSSRRDYSRSYSRSISPRRSRRSRRSYSRSISPMRSRRSRRSYSRSISPRYNRRSIRRSRRSYSRSISPRYSTSRRRRYNYYRSISPRYSRRSRRSYSRSISFSPRHSTRSISRSVSSIHGGGSPRGTDSPSRIASKYKTEDKSECRRRSHSGGGYSSPRRRRRSSSKRSAGRGISRESYSHSRSMSSRSRSCTRSPA